MLTFINLATLSISLYFYTNHYITNFNDANNAINNKIYIFLFVFIINFISVFINSLLSNSNSSIYDIITYSVNGALISVIAFDVFNDLLYKGIFNNYNHQQKSLLLILLIITFMTIVRLIQIIITYNF